MTEEERAKIIRAIAEAHRIPERFLPSTAPGTFESETRREREASDLIVKAVAEAEREGKL